MEFIAFSKFFITSVLSSSFPPKEFFFLGLQSNGRHNCSAILLLDQLLLYVVSLVDIGRTLTTLSYISWSSYLYINPLSETKFTVILAL